MGLFGGGNSSSNTTNNSYSANTSSADYSQLDGGNQSKVDLGLNNSTAGALNISLLDGGAVKGAFDFGNETVKQAIALSTEAFKQIGNSGQRETETAMANINSAAASKNPDSAISGDLIKYGVIAIVSLAVVYAVIKSKGN